VAAPRRLPRGWRLSDGRLGGEAASSPRPPAVGAPPPNERADGANRARPGPAARRSRAQEAPLRGATGARSPATLITGCAEPRPPILRFDAPWPVTWSSGPPGGGAERARSWWGWPGHPDMRGRWPPLRAAGHHRAREPRPPALRAARSRDGSGGGRGSSRLRDRVAERSSPTARTSSRGRCGAAAKGGLATRSQPPGRSAQADLP